MACIVNVNIKLYSKPLFTCSFGSPFIFSFFSRGSVSCIKRSILEKVKKCFVSHRPLISLKRVGRSNRCNKIATIGSGSRFWSKCLNTGVNWENGGVRAFTDPREWISNTVPVWREKIKAKVKLIFTDRKIVVRLLPWKATCCPLSLIYHGHPTSIFGKYLFGRRFEI